MKKILLFTLATLLMAFASTTSVQAQEGVSVDLMKDVVKAVNDGLPMDAGNGLYMIHVALDENNKVLNYTFYTNGEMVTLGMMKENYQIFRDAFKSSFVNSDDENLQFIMKWLKLNKYSLRIKYVDDTDDGNVIFTIPNSEL